MASVEVREGRNSLVHCKVSRFYSINVEELLNVFTLCKIERLDVLKMYFRRI
jgi:hypothetical protein